ncbi:hypothetical protein HBI56_005660 [Parastagonospora nodorum]|uniref:Uncharacterized protein n=1 Tax=Phaeosphaeria nodorum (strain SN15 / ATCC MYA-4574 / FGSC 10173) TaxID=321614 RepID=A0A7U2EQZ0_PHANO|nr:hypothetical protein HBH56_124010 [Parastagonospora nodorum]QRC91172.1 hypothetical protein JI435_401060 [Parastagonospora nodorum SN15]KAH3935239.1 hypothetical protein HBH54_049550 [Parastagonospora nodorum]KAH3950025.1 hypothetical protein HBH53_079810 [Parastagonospora nodorum]KAH3982805.1 hypothetical protein HBH51_037580 [Parastagonospora nodorum]
MLWSGALHEGGATPLAWIHTNVRLHAASTKLSKFYGSDGIGQDQACRSVMGSSTKRSDTGFAFQAFRRLIETAASRSDRHHMGKKRILNGGMKLFIFVPVSQLSRQMHN